RGVWDGNNTISYDWTIDPQLLVDNNTWTTAGTHTVTNTPVLGRIFISSANNNGGGLNDGTMGPIRLSTIYGEVITEKINNAPLAEFTATPDELTVVFEGVGSQDFDGTVDAYAWDFGDGNTSDLAAPTHTYAAPGTYSVSLTVTDNEGLSGEAATQEITVTEPFVATFPYQINFQDEATPPPAGYLKDFGEAYGVKEGELIYGWIKQTDGTPVNLNQPSNGAGRNRDAANEFDLEPRQETLIHMQGDGIWPNDVSGRGNEGVWEIEVPDGWYEVTVSVGDLTIEGNSDNISTHFIRVEGQEAIPLFAVDNTLSAGDPGRFMTGMSIVNVTDGKLTIDADDAGDVANNTKINYAIIAETEAPNTPPVVENQTFDTDENSTGVVGILVASDVDVEDELSFAITAGNDDNLFTLDAATGELTLAVAQDHETTEQLTLTVEVSDGEATDAATITINVLDVNEAPTAVAEATPTTGAAPLLVSFAGTSSTDPEENVLTYSWAIPGETDPLTGVTVDYTFPTAGTFAVTLTVTDGEFDDTETISIVVTETPNEAPMAAFTADPLTGDAPLTVSFDASGSTDSDGTITAYNWDFGDGETGSGVMPSHDFLAVGEYTVNLTVIDDDGVTSAEVTETITVTEAPNTPPVVENQNFDFNENTTGLIGALVATDVDAGDEINFTITAGNDDNLFTLDAVTGELTLDVAQDYETTEQLTLT
ncbi:MAG: PKD domain-containing protein, partial [Bacteroidota bacterium]